MYKNEMKFRRDVNYDDWKMSSLKEMAVPRFTTILRLKRKYMINYIQSIKKQTNN